ncbi:hypothetical protein TcBrA4_0010170 [Trypanosoma cruzi]|nr:hypothetical protein TcBrA4_0010170 [Trypanosoma cruzi]
MAAAFAESLQREVDTAIREAASHRGGLRRRVAAACDRIRQQQALARAEALTPLFRADLLRRGRAIQKNRARLMQTLKRFARVLPSGDLCESSGLPNVVAVFRVAQEALRVEEELAYWRQPLPREEAWCAVCTAVREGGYRADAPLQLPAATEQQQHRRKERQEAALEHLLFPGLHERWVGRGGGDGSSGSGSACHSVDRAPVFLHRDTFLSPRTGARGGGSGERQQRQPAGESRRE